MQGPETRLLEAARRARQMKLTTKQMADLDRWLTVLERLLESPAERQTREIVGQPGAAPSHSGQLPSPQPEFANTR
jgi:hypothetical protein